MQTFLISISGADRVGVISSVSGTLYDAGVNLADASFAVLGEGFEFSALGEVEASVGASDIHAALSALACLEDARISVEPAPYASERLERGAVTHIVEFSGGDRPGLVARMSEVLQNHNANIVRMTSRRTERGGTDDYRTRFAVNVAAAEVEALENALFNTAGSLGLACEMNVARP